MEKTKHIGYIREVPDSRTVVLFIHGILGTPNHFSRLVEVVPEEWSIYNILLAGHGKTVEDFAAATMEQWKMQVHRLVLKLGDKYEHIIITAHSMGTLFAISEAVKNPKIQALFLLNVPLKVHLKPGIIMNSLKIIFDKVKPEDTVSVSLQKAYSIAPDKHLWKYLRWLPNYLALFSEIRSTGRKIEQIHVPCVVFQSKNDELVGISAVRYLRGNEKIRCRLLENSGHFYYEESDMKEMIRIFQYMFKKNVRGGHYSD